MNEDQKKILARFLLMVWTVLNTPSRKTNILFNILGWGNKVLAILADKESGKFIDQNTFFKGIPIF